MSASRAILDLNRCFEPNAFNTGPPIPSAYDSDSLGTPPRKGRAIPPRLGTPELTASPSSTISSSLALEDEEIRRIFDDRQSSFSADYIFRTYGHDVSGKEELNPLAVPFVPSFMHDASIEPFPHTQLSPFVSDPAQPSCPPLYPPGLAPPCRRRPSQTAPQTPPLYLDILSETIKPTASSHDRRLLSRAIVTTTANWSLEALLELAEYVVAQGFSSSKEQTDEPVCDPARYVSVQESRRRPSVDQKESPEDRIAEVAGNLHQLFLELHGEELAQSFAWNLRETVLTRFIACWDCDKPSSISWISGPTPFFVRSALALCKITAALFKQRLIMPEHISMCLSILLKDLLSVEHVEALGFILLGCGAQFWTPSNNKSATNGENAPAEPTLLFGLVFTDVQAHLNDHIQQFIAGLNANVTSRNLDDHTSILGRPWGEGQLKARVKELLGAVKTWEAHYVAANANQTSPSKRGRSLSTL